MKGRVGKRRMKDLYRNIIKSETQSVLVCTYLAYLCSLKKRPTSLKRDLSSLKRAVYLAYLCFSDKVQSGEDA